MYIECEFICTSLLCISQLTMTRKIKIGKLFFSFVSARYASLMKVGSKLRGGRVCLSLVGTEPPFSYALKDCNWYLVDTRVLGGYVENLLWLVGHARKDCE